MLAVCLWCHGTLAKSDTSHIVPQVLGNRDQQILPPGIVCHACNNYFGSKIEPWFVDDPLFHPIAVALRIVDPGDANVFRDRLFQHPNCSAEPPLRTMEMNVRLSGQRAEVEVRCEVKGRIVKEYTRNGLSFVSRAVHKMAFESFAHSVLVKESVPGVNLLDPRLRR